MKRGILMTIYLDAVWMLNILFDMTLLMLTNYLAKANTSRLRIIGGSLFASLIVPIYFYAPYSFFTTTIGKLLYSIIIILITFRFITVFHFLKLFMLFYFVTFMIGGGLIASYYFFEHPLTTILNDFAIHSRYGDPLSWLFIVISFPIFSIFLKKQMDRHRLHQLKHDNIYSVMIEMNDQAFETKGYLDTGNQLIDPLTKQPVIICDAIFLQQWFTKQDWDLLRKANKHKDFKLLPAKWANKARLIPFYGVSGKRDLLMALKPERVIIYANDEKLMNNQILIGIQFRSLTADQTYHCLLHPQLFAKATNVS